ncbi:MAG: molybdopterin molybdenumtransferase MoeA [Streptosporangiales bacterium]|nr:molybdopterin molybdenumtransferase MoeA [Streptosporangiales bacterium]
MKPVDAYLAEILGTVRPLDALELALLEARGCPLAEHVAAPEALPAFDNSAMDGYAVRAADIVDADDRPVTLPVVGDIPAGEVGVFAIPKAMSARIMTGAPLPAGADTVVPVEWTDGGVARVEVRRSASRGQFVRRRGEDVDAGDVVLRPGVRLGAAQIGLLAAIGRRTVTVRPRPRVAVISTGNELVEPGTQIAPGQIADSNSYTLTAAAAEAGCAAYRHGIVPDDPQAVMSAIEDQLLRSDMIITSGGVSMGAYDAVKEVLSQLGTVRFERVAMQPGMPQGFGVIGDDETPIFTLPGNPVSAFVSFQVFAVPALRKMQGLDPMPRAPVRAALTAPLRSPEGKRSYGRARVEPREGGELAVTPVQGQGSHQLAHLAWANAFVIVPEQVTELGAGETVEVMVLEEPQGVVSTGGR